MIVNFLTDERCALARSSGLVMQLYCGERLLIKSPAGEFPITIDRFEIEGSELVIVGKMGVWDARTHVPPRDFIGILGKLFFSPAVLWYALKAPFAAARQRRGSPSQTN